MFSKNDYVMYGLTGVCKVADIRKESEGSQRGEEYFILHPVRDEYSKIMIPVSRGAARMRSLVNKSELMKFMEDMRESEDIWESDMKERGKNVSGEIEIWFILSVAAPKQHHLAGKRKKENSRQKSFHVR
ncbi:CarD family transcriptional regulator [Proteiniclasticum sp.]|uniref:CarD family transcriptional regulator n=1 Tax=Proteiniclasticum sp. TaxID=2053595 RepID=UPI00289EEF50|nr:CarD family transcriptional regulator [Proteiniclasticum sp.]